ncbi:sialidase family protein [Aeromonas rivipollensis]|uniref:Exo-alpha-sialidase n=1 Tax=Aeromonas rivipollensis TaxID=948519 RepID=A0AAW9YDJ0_9GAMM|nr:sialidase family protein [Aeromonas rivipollensis]NEX75857.1 exo-alpha-sialidase [Aeromonas rivipollensis]
MAEQLDNGWLYMNMRNNHRSIGAFRAVTYSKDGGENWMGTEYDHIPKTGSSNFWRDIGYDSTLISPKVQSSILRYSSDKDETGVSRLLFSKEGANKSLI